MILGFQIPKSGDLTYFATQGVLLLNTILTVEQARPLVHKKYRLGDIY